LGYSTALRKTFQHRIYLRLLFINAQIVKTDEYYLFLNSDWVGKADVWVGLAQHSLEPALADREKHYWVVWNKEKKARKEWETKVCHCVSFLTIYPSSLISPVISRWTVGAREWSSLESGVMSIVGFWYLNSLFSALRGRPIVSIVQEKVGQEREK